MKWNFECANLRRDYLQNQFVPATNSIPACIKLDNPLDREATAADPATAAADNFGIDGIDETDH
jgi:hypothetical protein